MCLGCPDQPGPGRVIQRGVFRHHDWCATNDDASSPLPPCYSRIDPKRKDQQHMQRILYVAGRRQELQETPPPPRSINTSPPVSGAAARTRTSNLSQNSKAVKATAFRSLALTARWRWGRSGVPWSCCRWALSRTISVLCQGFANRKTASLARATAVCDSLARATVTAALQQLVSQADITRAIRLTATPKASPPAPGQLFAMLGVG